LKVRLQLQLDIIIEIMSWIGSGSPAQTGNPTVQPDEQLNKEQLKTKIDGFVSQSPQSLYLIDGYVNI